MSDIEGTIYDITKGVRAIGEHGTKNVGDIGKAHFGLFFGEQVMPKRTSRRARVPIRSPRDIRDFRKVNVYTICED